MKKFKQFLKKHFWKVMLVLTGLIIFLFPKLRALFTTQDSTKLVNTDGTTPVDDDYELLPDTQAQADLIAQAIYSHLHLENVPVNSEGFYDTSSANYSPIDYHAVISLMNANKPIIREIQERFSHRYNNQDFLVCFPFFATPNSINILTSAFSDVTNFIINTHPSYKMTDIGFGVLQPKPFVYPSSQMQTLGDYYNVYYNQFSAHYGEQINRKIKAY